MESEKLSSLALAAINGGAACDRLAGTPDGVGLAAIDVPVAVGQTLVTGDKVLLTLRDRYTIFTPAEFWTVHDGL